MTVVANKNIHIGVIDIGGTKIDIGVARTDGAIVCKQSVLIETLAGWEGGVAAIGVSLKDCVQRSGIELSGIGIGCTGPVDPIAGVIGKVANLPGWEGCRLVGEMVSRFAVPTVMENDADAAALAEAQWGSGRGIKRLLYLTISTGIGGGFVLGGELYRGVDGSHPEMGHHTIDPSGPNCYCGARGCWESFVSGAAIRQWFLEHDTEHHYPPSHVNARKIFELSAAGDRAAQAAVSRLTYYLGLGLANMTTILVPDVIALGGGLMRSSSSFLDGARDVMREVCGEVPSGKTVICPASLGEDIGLAGALAAWISRA